MPRGEFPKATLLAVILILLVFIFPTLAISVAVPAPHISFTAGVMQAFKSLLDHFGLSVLTPIIAVGLVVASLSGLLDWLTGPSTGLLDIARERGYLPRYFQELNSNGVQLHILVAQGLIITVIGLLYAVVPAVSRAYWVFAALATEVYLIMYVLMFVAAINLRRRQPEHPRGYRAPALLAICVVGTLASAAACVIGLLPPSQLGHITTVALPPGAARRDPARRPAPAAPAPQAAPARLEGRCLRRGGEQPPSGEGLSMAHDLLSRHDGHPRPRPSQSWKARE